MTDATPSPRGTLSRLKRNLGDSNESNNSLASSSNSDDPNASSGLQPTTAEGVGRKLRARLRRRSVDDRRDSNDSGKRLSNLIPGRKNKPKKTDSDELERQSSVDSAAGNVGLGLVGNQSDSSLLAGSGQSSLLTDGESEHEG